MRIIHCADIHLDSPMTSLGDNNKRKIRRAELLEGFTSMVSFAKENAVDAIIIAGDLFDTNRTSSDAFNCVFDSIKSTPYINWYYLKGNHDSNDFLQKLDCIPNNLFLFSHSFQCYKEKNGIVISGIEICKDNCDSLYDDINLNYSNFNIVIMHGQETKSKYKLDENDINLKMLQNKNIDYLALGHIHGFKYEKLDVRGTYCYPGCLEQRGFDESNKHGFVVLDIDEKQKSFSASIVNNPIRRVYELRVDVQNLNTSLEIVDAIEKALLNSKASEDDYLKLVLEGKLDLDADKNLEYIEVHFKDRFFAFKLCDETKVYFDYEKYRGEKSLKGEFIRLVEGEKNLSDDEKAELVGLGIRALRGDWSLNED